MTRKEKWLYNMIKVSKKMFNKFLNIINSYDDEFLFGTKEEIKKQLEVCLNTQGYWAGNMIRIFYNEDTKQFSIESRW